VLIPKFHYKTTFHDKEEFIFMIMLVPNELALKLYELHVLTVQFTRNPRVKVVREQIEFLR
jgi:hypothetical protein